MPGLTAETENPSGFYHFCAQIQRPGTTAIAPHAAGTADHRRTVFHNKLIYRQKYRDSKSAQRF